LGLVIVDGIQISHKKTSSLFNGFAVIEDSGFRIQESMPESFNVFFALQSGPILIMNGGLSELALERDKPSRRMVMGQTADNKVVFMSVYGPVIENMGPYLQELPALIKKISEMENLNLIAAINMDGGQASAMYTPDNQLSEIEPVGSWWCAK
jgi:exopolysaccharide biosynthesis protein